METSHPSRLRVLMVTARYLPFTGGVELHVDQTARRLAARGVDMSILTTDPSGRLPVWEQLEGVSVRRVRAWPANRDYYLAPQIYQEMRRGDWDIAHVHAYHTFVGPLAMFAAVRSELPFVLTFHAGGHSSRLRHSLRPLQLSLLRPLIARADRLVALAPFEIEHYSRRLGVPRGRFVVIPNGSDLPMARQSEVARDENFIVSIGRLERYKGHHRVLKAFPHVLRRRPHARLWIAGTGPYENTLRALADEIGLTDRVEIRAVPPREREQMAKELSQASVVVLLSEFETQPIAALEARTLGCRLVVADTPGLRVLADEGLARAIPLESSAEDVAAAILEELEKPPTSPGAPLATWDDCANGLLKLYRDVVVRQGKV